MTKLYSLPQMSSIWEEDFKFKTMLKTELFTLEALAKENRIPFTAVEKIKKKANFNLKEIEKIEEKIQHDLVAFITNVSQDIGKDAKYLHLGLTSLDILNTTLGSAT